MTRVIRTICLFSSEVKDQDIEKLDKISNLLEKNDFHIQTKRICLPCYKSDVSDKELFNKGILLGMGELNFKEFKKCFSDFLKSENKAVSLDLTHENITIEHIDILFKIIKNKPENTFRFTYGFNANFKPIFSFFQIRSEWFWHWSSANRPID